MSTFYTKDVIDGKMIRVPLYDTEFFAECHACGAEIAINHLDFADIISLNDGLLTAKVFCSKCKGVDAQ